MESDFYVIDVETANSDYASICQIGIVGYSREKIVSEYETLVNPKEGFDDINIEIHGITPSYVRHSPILPDIYQRLETLLKGNIVVCHSPFDRLAMNRACNKYGLAQISCSWLDSTCVVRRTWRQFARSGYSLGNVCEFLGHKFRHHNALEDAKAAGHIVLEACRKEGIQVQDWLARIKTDPSRNIRKCSHEIV
ncbi:MAG: 3'-5' exoribonuclease [Desulfovibrio sp.]|nr:3'-5' exoribonuclease [Desulfovibrio sp.]